LIAPPRSGLIEGLPHSLLALSNYIQVKSPQHKVTIMDLGLQTWNSAAEAVCRHIKRNSDVKGVGFTVTTATYQASLHLATKIKTNYTQIPIIFGGPHPSFEDDIILKNHPEVDCVICGEGEKPLLKILNRKNENLWIDIPSASYRKDGKTVKNKQARLLSSKELSEIPLDLSVINSNVSLGRDQRVTYVAARGCPQRCSFCAAGRTPFRSKSTKRINTDLNYLASINISQVAFEDNDFFYSIKRSESLCYFLKELKIEYSDFNWDCQTRLDNSWVPEIVQNMADSSCERVYLGLENFDKRCLQFLLKTVDPKSYIDKLMNKTLPLLFSNGINVSLNLQIGIPVENERSQEINLAYLKKVGEMAKSYKRTVEICPMLHVLYPGTMEFDELSEELSIPDNIFELYTKWEQQNTNYLEFLSKKFAHGSGGIPIGIMNHTHLKNGIFVVNEYRLDSCLQFIEDMKNIKGIEVLNYLKFLSK